MNLIFSIRYQSLLLNYFKPKVSSTSFHFKHAWPDMTWSINSFPCKVFANLFRQKFWLNRLDNCQQKKNKKSVPMWLKKKKNNFGIEFGIWRILHGGFVNWKEVFSEACYARERNCLSHDVFDVGYVFAEKIFNDTLRYLEQSLFMFLSFSTAQLQ